MAAPTNTETTLTAKGLREDLSNLIFRVAAEQTPFLSAIGRTTAKAIYHEWQTETLATPDADNAALEGGDVGTHGAPNRTARVGNTCQILTKDGVVSGTMEVVDKAGRKSEFARQKLIKGKEAMRDLEARAIGNKAAVAEAGATTRKMGGALAWTATSTNRGAGGADGGFSATPGPVAATNGTQRSFTEAQLKDVLQKGFNQGATMSAAFMGGAHKQIASSFTGIADIRVDAPAKKAATIMAAADFYTGDFGTVGFVPHPYGLTRDCLVIDPDMWALATLRAWDTKPLAKTGDNERFQLVGEFTLECKNEKSSGAVADLS